MKLSKNLLFVVVGLLLISVLGCDSTDMTSAKVYLQQKNYEKAEEMLLLAFDKEPANPDPAYFLATEIYARSKTWDKVADYLSKSEAIGTKNAEKIKMAREKYWVDNFNLGAKGYNALIKGGVEDEEALYNSVIAAFQNCMLLDASKPEANSTIAQVYLFKGDFEKGKAAMVKAVDMNPEDITSRINLGNVLFRDKEYEGALLHLTKALEIDPSNLNAIKQIAFVYDAMGEKAKATEAYTNAIEVDPENTDLHYNLGVLYFQQENFEAASVEFIKVAELSPTEVDGLFNAGLAFGRMKNFEEAERYLEMAYELTPESLDVVHELKMAYYHNHGVGSEKFKTIDKVEKSLK